MNRAERTSTLIRAIGEGAGIASRILDRVLTIAIGDAKTCCEAEVETDSQLSDPVNSFRRDELIARKFTWSGKAEAYYRMIRVIESAVNETIGSLVLEGELYRIKRDEADPLLLTVPEAASRIGIAARTVWSLIESGSLKCVRLGKRATRIEVSEVDRFIGAKVGAERGEREGGKA